MTAGYWHLDYWQNHANGEYWHDDYWQDYGLVAPADPVSGRQEKFVLVFSLLARIGGIE